MSFDYEIIRSNRRTASIQIKNGQVYARVPKRMTDLEVLAFVREHEEWVEKHLGISKERMHDAEVARKLSEDEKKAIVEKAKKVIPERVAYYADLMGVDYGRVTIRMQKTRWGSCTSDGNLNFNCLLMLTPIEVIDSVVVHELCHRKQMNHSKEFYREVYAAYPEYNRWNRWLKNHGTDILNRAF